MPGHVRIPTPRVREGYGISCGSAGKRTVIAPAATAAGAKRCAVSSRVRETTIAQAGARRVGSRTGEGRLRTAPRTTDHATAHEPRCAVPRAREQPHPRPRRQPGRLRPGVGARRRRHGRRPARGCCASACTCSRRSAGASSRSRSASTTRSGSRRREVDLDYHVREIALPAPGDLRQLAEQSARIFERRLDRSRPLWEMYLIHGVENGTKVGLLTKVHHAALDGLSGAEILVTLMDLEPHGREIPLPEPGGVRDSVPSRLRAARARAHRHAAPLGEGAARAADDAAEPRPRADAAQRARGQRRLRRRAARRRAAAGQGATTSSSSACSRPRRASTAGSPRTGAARSRRSRSATSSGSRTTSA